MNDILKYIRYTAKNFRTSNLSHEGKLFSQELGETMAENQLAKLLREKFSNYICFINPYFEKGQELADAIVILNNNIIIFSDKSCKKFNNLDDIQSLDDLNFRWKNFYSEIKKSEKQLNIAKDRIIHRLNNYKLKFFIDKECSQDIEICFDNKINFFLISTVSGLTDISKKFLNKDGVLPIDQSEHIQNNKKTFSITNKFKNNDFYQILDIESLKLLLEYLNTPIDFISYLKFRYDFFKKNKNFKLKSEKQILFLYKINNSNYKIEYDKNIDEIDFLNLNDKQIENFKFISHNKESLIVDDLIDIVAYQHSQDVDYYTDQVHRIRVNKWVSLNRMERIEISSCLKKLIQKSEQFFDKNICEISYINGKHFCIYLCYRPVSFSDQKYIEYRRKKARSIINKIKNKTKNGISEMFFIFLDHPMCELTTITDFYEY